MREVSDKQEHEQKRVHAWACVCVYTHFLTFLTFMLAVLLLQERMRGSALSSGISALLAWTHKNAPWRQGCNSCNNTNKPPTMEHSTFYTVKG